MSEHPKPEFPTENLQNPKYLRGQGNVIEIGEVATSRVGALLYRGDDGYSGRFQSLILFSFFLCPMAYPRGFRSSAPAFSDMGLINIGHSNKVNHRIPRRGDSH